MCSKSPIKFLRRVMKTLPEIVHGFPKMEAGEEEGD